MSVAILTFMGSMIFNQSRTYRSKPHLAAITLQLLNGCGVNGACEKLANALLPGEENLLYDIIERTDARFDGFDRTVIVDRRGSSSEDISEAAKRIAIRLGIDKNDILQVRLADNLLDIDVTIIAGADYMRYIETLNSSKGEDI